MVRWSDLWLTRPMILIKIRRRNADLVADSNRPFRLLVLLLLVNYFLFIFFSGFVSFGCCCCWFFIFIFFSLDN